MKPRARVALWLLACVGPAWLLRGWLAAHPFALTLRTGELSLRRPEALALLCALPLLAASVSNGRRPIDPRGRGRLFWMRALLLGCIACALGQPVWASAASGVQLIVAIDASDSIDPADARRARELAAKLQRAAGAPFTLLEFASDARHLTSEPRVGSSESDAGWRRATNLQAALQLAYGVDGHGRARRVLLLSDGRQTHGDLLAEAGNAARLGVELDYLTLSSTPPAEVGIRALTGPLQTEISRPFGLRATLFTTRVSDVELRLYQGEQAQPLASRSLRLQPFDTNVEFPLVAHLAGPVEYRIEIHSQDPDRFAANNRAQTTLWVRGPPRMLIVDSVGDRAQPLLTALRSQGLDVQLRSPLGLPRSTAELAEFDFVLLSDVPAAQLPPTTLKLLDSYVHDAGGGLLVSGGTQSFGPGGYRDTRLAQLLPVYVAGETRLDEPALALALLIDCSGSMAGAKLELAKEAAQAATSVLGDADQIEVIGFAGEPARIVRMQSARNRANVVQSIARLAAQGGTQLLPALDLAYQDLAATRARRKHVIVLTDGQTEESGLAALIQAMHSEGITLSTVGLGRDVNRPLLQDAASTGAGRAYFTDDPNSVPRIFVHETTAQKQNSTPEQPTRLHAREPADFLRGVDLEHAPALLGYVVTQPKPAPAQLLLASDSGAPLLARTRYGLGTVLAFTSDLHARWSANLMSWRGFGPLFAQLVREHVRKPELEGFPLHAEIRDGTAVAVLDASDTEGRYVHGLRPTLELIGQSASTAMTEVAPGRYEGELPLPGYGAFALRASYGTGRHSHARISNPYPEEYLPGAPDEALLARAAAIAGGRALHEASLAAALRPAHLPGRTRVELAPYLSWLAFALFACELTLRRLSVFRRHFT